MTDPVVVYGFETSNNMKVRIALGYKGIPYRFQSIDPGDRDEIVRLSGQYLTPVLIHGDRVVSDSGAILRYLDHAFADTPRLYGDSRTEQWAIEDEELFARAILAGPIMAIVHHKVDGGTVDVARAVVYSTELLPQSATRFTASFENLSPGTGVVQVEVVVVEERDDDFGLG